MTSTADRSLSDFWRTDRHDDRALELISVLRGADNLIGLMGSALRARWSGAELPDGTRLSYTDLANGIVALDYSPLSGQETPFPGSKVDEVLGYAAHEGGHCVWTEPDKAGTIQSHVVRALLTMPRSFQRDWKAGERNKVPDGDGGWVNPVLGELCRIQNILEDAYIDYHVAGKWEVLGEYIRVSRQRLADKTPIDLDAIARSPKPDRNAAINVWVSVALYDYDVPTKMLTKMRRGLTALLELTEKAIKEPDGMTRQLMAVDAAEILWREFPAESAPLPRKPEPGDGGQGESQGAGGQSMPAAGAPGKGDGDEDGDEQAPGASGAGGASGSDQDDDDGEDAGGGGDDSEADEAEGDDPATTGSQPDDDGDPDDKPDDDGTGDADGGQDAIDDLAQRLANALNQRASDLSGADEAGDEADGAGDGAGELGNLDAYDDRERVEVPEDLLRDILEALQAELEDISEPVADILAEDPRMVAANVQRAQYDSEAARKVTDRVTAQVAEIRRVFDRQKDAATDYLRGQERGKLDSRKLWKVGVGDMKVRKRRIVKASPEMAVGLLLDVSGSMEKSMPIVLETGAVFAEGLAFKRGVNFAAWTYTGGRNEVALTRICDRAMGKLCLGNIVYGGGTPSGCAIAGVKVLMDRMPEARRMLIHFTDGQPDSMAHVYSAVKACRAAGIGVYSIGQGARLASTLEHQYGKGNWETIDEITELPSAVGRLLQRLVTAD